MSTSRKVEIDLEVGKFTQVRSSGNLTSLPHEKENRLNR